MKTIFYTVIVGIGVTSQARIKASEDALIEIEQIREDSTLKEHAIAVVEKLQLVEFQQNEEGVKNIETIQRISFVMLARFRYLPPDKVTKEDLNEVAKVTKAIFQKIDASIEEDYTFPLGNPNVAPPPGSRSKTGGGLANGMDPEQIEPLEKREEYKQLIAAERQKSLKNRQQRQLRNTREQLVRLISELAKGSLKDRSKAEIIQQFTDTGKIRDMLEKEMKTGNGCK